MTPTPTIEQADEKVETILSVVRPLVDKEHLLVEGLVAAELTTAFIMKHEPKIRRRLARMQYQTVVLMLETKRRFG